MQEVQHQTVILIESMAELEEQLERDKKRGFGETDNVMHNDIDYKNYVGYPVDVNKLDHRKP